MLSAAILSVTVAPALRDSLIRGRIYSEERRESYTSFVNAAYRRYWYDDEDSNEQEITDAVLGVRWSLGKVDLATAYVRRWVTGETPMLWDYYSDREDIYQKLALADNIDAAANVFLGRELRTKTGSLDDEAMDSATQKVMQRLNPRFKNLKTAVKSLSGGQRQSVAIARAVHFNARILIMDEPTAALGPAETAQVRDLITQLKSEGIGIFLISHDIHDVFDLADRISVMLQGKLVGTVNKNDVTKDEVLAMIIAGKQPGESTKHELAALHD